MKCCNSKNFEKQKGNMAEYVLPAVLIGMVAVAGLTWSLSGQFAAQGGRTLFQAETSQVSSNGKALLNNRAFGKNPYLQTYTLTLANGKTIQIPDMPISVTENIDVDGGHGTTEKLLAAMETLRKALVESGELTEADSQPFKDLANAGHTFGASQSGIEDIMQRCGDSKSCVYDAFFLNGRSTLENLSLGSVKNALGQANNTLSDFSLNDVESFAELHPGLYEKVSKDPSFNYDINNLRFGSDLATFLSAYRKVMTLPVLQSNLQTKQFVSQMSKNIMSLQVATIHATTVTAATLSMQDQMNNSSEPSSEFQALKPNGYKATLSNQFNGILTNPDDSRFVSSQFTHSQSGMICSTGQRSDDGTHCH